MRKNLLFISALIILVLTNQLKAQTAATATWTLAPSSPAATISGSITANDQILGSAIGGTTYGSGYNIGGSSNTGWQRCATSPNLPTAYDPNSYVDYKVTPSGGQHFTMTTFEAELLGGGSGLVRVALYWSVDNFATSQQVGTCAYNSLTVAGSTDAPVALINSGSNPAVGAQQLTVPTFIPVTPSQTLIIRIYAWCGSASKYLASKNIKITGVTSAASLPLSLKSFSASVEKSTNKLSWNTQSEINMKSFEVEKSVDGRNFNNIGSTVALNNSNNSYSFADNNVVASVNYYRLKMVNRDGSFAYSYTVTCNSRLKDNISVFPNPAVDIITIKHPATTSKTTVLSILSQDGRKVKQIVVGAGVSQTTIEVANLPIGIYSVQFDDNGILKAASFIKK